MKWKVFLIPQLIAHGLSVSPGRAAVDPSDQYHVTADVNHPALKYYSLQYTLHLMK